MKNNPFSLERFSDLERGKVAMRLDRLAEVRKAAVARGKSLVKDPHYPGKAVITRVSKLLAARLTA